MPAGPGARFGARARRSLGARAKTSRTVSLKVRTEEKPAAKAISVIGRVVVSMSSRAVCARWARARARGPAPSSASSWRSTCRVL
ncbi:hypothetical protein SHIRM173S_00585 [Streptomyces hirsutus]